MLIDSLKALESIDFAASVNVASDLTIFLKAIASEDLVIEVLHEVQEKPTQINQLYRRMRHFTELAYDERYAHRYDVAMATYGWVIATARPRFEGLISDLLFVLNNSWWSGMLAEHYQTQETSLRARPMQSADLDHVRRAPIVDSYACSLPHVLSLEQQFQETPEDSAWQLVDAELLVSHTKFRANLGTQIAPEEFGLWYGVVTARTDSSNQTSAYPLNGSSSTANWSLRDPSDVKLIPEIELVS